MSHDKHHDKHKSKKHDESDASSSDASSSDASSSDASASDAKEEKVEKKKDKKDKTKDKKSSHSSDKNTKNKKDKKHSKSEKSEKSSRRGPKGVQWIHWKIPYQEDSILGRSFKLASARGGVDIEKLFKYIKTWGGTPAFIFRGLRKGRSKGFTWDVDDSNNRLRIVNTKLANKSWHR